MKSTFAVLFALASLSACSSTPTDPNKVAAEPKEELEYVTGSALPQKRGQTNVAKLTREQIEEQQRAAAHSLDRAAGGGAGK